VSDMDPDGRVAPELPLPWSDAGPEPGWSDAGPEPAWADAIRRGRKARGDQLREVFATFGDDGPDPPASSRPAGGGDEGS
jgi:hypothetical protein